ncbi:MAG: hypothetical protein Q8N99_02695 [Nanoarchaeota archaeon]|nr:hypothetical protein [Nanoarchaeota archaeon]
MKNLIVILFLFVFLIGSVSACQYKINESYSQEEEWFYFDGDFVGANLEMDKLVWVENSHLSFTVYNNLTIPVTVRLDYKVVSTWFGLDEVKSVEVKVEPRDSDRYDDGHVNTQLNSYIGITDLDYTLIEPEVSSEYKNVEKQKEVCRTCPNGKQCLDDNSLCISDNECGSSICNIVGFCGKDKIISCEHYGKLNCKNQTCLMPSTKEVGEAYMCEWECKSDRFEEGICLKSSEQLQKEREERIKQLSIFGVIIFIVVLLSYLYIEKWKRGKVKKERQKEEEKVKDIRNEIIKLGEEKERINEDIKGGNKEIQKLESQKANRLNEIKDLEEKIRHSKGEIKEKYEQELIRLRNKNKETEDKLKIQRKELLEQEKELKTKEKELEKRTEAYWKEKALIDSGQKQNLRFNEEGRLVFKNSGKLYHVWKYEDYLKKKGQKILDNISIHHIDRNKYNNEIWNLVPMDKKIHDINNRESVKGKFNHNLIESYNWESGIHQIKEQLGWKDSDFPEQIQKELNEGKNRQS